MPDQLTKERIDQEVVSANHDKLYQATKKEVEDHELKATAQENKKLLRQSTKLGLDMAIELIDLRNKLKENNSARDNGLRLSKETKPKPEPTYAELKASHDNHFLDRQIEMIRKELITMISEKGGK